MGNHNKGMTEDGKAAVGSGCARRVGDRYLGHLEHLEQSLIGHAKKRRARREPEIDQYDTLDCILRILYGATHILFALHFSLCISVFVSVPVTLHVTGHVPPYLGTWAIGYQVHPFRINAMH